MVTLKDVEEGAVTLRKVGESLAGLKGKTTENILTTGNTAVYNQFSSGLVVSLIIDMQDSA